MLSARPGTSLPETLLALVLLSALAAWALAAAATAERRAGSTTLRRAALHRAERAIADLALRQCDSTVGGSTVVEPRWQVTSSRTRIGNTVHDLVRLQSVRGDTVALQRGYWCGA